MRARIAAALALLAAAAAAQASPTGTPQANAPRDGKGSAIELPFGHHRDRTVSGNAAADAAVPRRHPTQAEWRKAYIVRHGHDLVAPAHPGH